MEDPTRKRFRILACIDGSDESYRALRYASKLGRGVDADICLLYVRASDQGLRSGGLQVDVARQNMLDWGLELPGLRYLNRARDILLQLGEIHDGVAESFTHTDIGGDPVGDNKVEYTTDKGRRIILKLKAAPNIVTGILDQWEIGQYDLIILGASERWREGRKDSFWDPAVAQKVAEHAPCSVIVSRELDEGSGHLICTDGSELALEAVRTDGLLASRCQCPISLMSVARTPEEEVQATEAVEAARLALAEMGIEIDEAIVRVGDPVEAIIDEGMGYTLIVVSDTKLGPFQRLFSSSVAMKVLQNARNSVMIVR